jgi:hypothetical protein
MIHTRQLAYKLLTNIQQKLTERIIFIKLINLLLFVEVWQIGFMEFHFCRTCINSLFNMRRNIQIFI